MPLNDEYESLNTRDTSDTEPAAAAAIGRRAFLRRAALAGAGVVLAPALAVDALTPRPAEAWQLVSRPSVDQQKQIGRQAAQQILQKYKEVHDSRARAFQDMGARLVAALPAADRNKWDYNFHVIESKDVNAFALPGGPMFIYTGLYDKLGTMDAMAGVTGHEMTHVRLEHWAKAAAAQQSRDFLLGLGLTILHAGRAAQTIASLADSAIGLKYSRGEENQADLGGLQNMVAAGYNPEGMVQLFETLQKLSGNGATLGGDFLSDHPLTSQRINAVRHWEAQQGGRSYPALTPIVR